MFYLHNPEYKQEKIKMRAAFFGRLLPLSSEAVVERF